MLRCQHDAGARSASLGDNRGGPLFDCIVREVGVEFDEVVRKRRMVHQFQRRQVPAELLQQVLDKALHAPSAGFSQGLELLVLQDQGSLDRFWRTTDTDGVYEQMLTISALGHRYWFWC